MPLASAIERCVAGDRTAYAEVVAAHADGLVGLLRRLVGDLEDARDIAQETFVRAYQNLHRYDRRRPLKPWLFRIARNLAYNHLKARQRRAEARVAADGGRQLERLESETPSPAAAVLQQERRSAVDQVLATMRPQFREVLLYRYMERLDYEEISAVMGIPTGTVKTWLFRAKEQFRARAAGREIF
jgi:RNA polymerase sigma-70 factor (ECF subfamily)